MPKENIFARFNLHGDTRTKIYINLTGIAKFCKKSSGTQVIMFSKEEFYLSTGIDQFINFLNSVEEITVIEDMER